MAGKKPKDVFVDKLVEAVQKAKKNRKWRHDYMTLLMRDRVNVEKGEEKERNRIMLNMIEQGYGNEQIMAVCGVTEEEVELSNMINE